MVTASGRVAGVELFGDRDDLAALPPCDPTLSSQEWYLPHFATGGGFDTQLLITSTRSTSTRLTVEARDEPGAVLQTREVQIPARNQMLVSLENLFQFAGRTPTGYLKISAPAAVQNLCIAGIYRFGQGAAAAAPAITSGKTDLLFGHVAHNVPSGSGVHYLTGLALLNPTGQAAAAQINLHESAGAAALSGSLTLRPGQKVARLLSGPADAYFGQRTLQQGGGYLRIRSDVPLIALELFFTADLSQMSNVAPQ